jgi:hypothetical protein
MKTIFTGVIASLLLAGSVLAHDVPVPTSKWQQDQETQRLHELRLESYRELSCNSDFQPVDLYAFCFNSATNKAIPVGAPVGGSDGSE